MKQISLLLFFISFYCIVNGQNNYDSFIKLYEKEDTTSMRLMLNTWKHQNSNVPEFYACSFFYSTATSIEENELMIMSMGQDSLPAGPFNNKSYNYRSLAKAFENLEKGISKFPNSINLRMLKCRASIKFNIFDTCLNETIRIIEYSSNEKNNWINYENEKIQLNLYDIRNNIFELNKLTNTDFIIAKKYRIKLMKLGDIFLKYYPLTEYPHNLSVIPELVDICMKTPDYNQAIKFIELAKNSKSTEFSK